MLNPEESIKGISFTRPQLFSIYQNAKKEIDISGRGRGKSTDIAWRIHKLVQTMPQSTTVISGDTFAQLLTITLAPVFAFLQQLGYYRYSHYVIGKPPTSWPLPHQAPADFSRYICFKNGTGFPLASQDRSGMNRGRNIDHVIGDEMLTQDKEKFEKEIMASKRGNLKRYGKNPIYLGFYLKSSMPTGIDSQWLLNYSKYYEEDGYDFWSYWNELVQLQLIYIDNRMKKAEMPDYASVQKELVATITQARNKIKFYKSKDDELFTCYNVFENIQNVGIDYICDMRKQMSDLSFRIEILNERIFSVERGFYNIDKRLLYTKYDYGEIDNCDYDFEKIKGLNTRKDGDVTRTKALDVGIDFGAAINAMAVGQAFDETEYRFLKSFYTKDHGGLKRLIDMFCDYYKDHKYKTVNLFYDQTGTGTHNVTLTHVQNTQLYFKEKGWNVVLKYIGAAPEHMLKYELWEQLLKESSIIKVYFNKDNFKDALLSMTMAEIKESEKGFKKDKSTERRSSVPREKATDLSDAVDLIAWGRFSNKVKKRSTFVDLRTM